MTEAEYYKYVKDSACLFVTYLKEIKELRARIAFLESLSQKTTLKNKSRPNPLGFKLIDGGKDPIGGPFKPVTPS